MNFAGIELSEEYCAIARARIRHYSTHLHSSETEQGVLDI
mgnify:CR=1 FL=1